MVGQIRIDYAQESIYRLVGKKLQACFCWVVSLYVLKRLRNYLKGLDAFFELGSTFSRRLQFLLHNAGISWSGVLDLRTDSHQKYRMSVHSLPPTCVLYSFHVTIPVTFCFLTSNFQFLCAVFYFLLSPFLLGLSSATLHFYLLLVILIQYFVQFHNHHCSNRSLYAFINFTMYPHISSYQIKLILMIGVSE